MWVNRDAWRRLQERVMDLERNLEASKKITVYKKLDYSAFYPAPIPRAYIPIENVVRSLCEHVGYELVYREGTPETALLQKKEKAK